MVGEERMVLAEGGMVPDKHLPETAQLLHVLGIVRQMLLPENLQGAVNPRMLLLTLVLVRVKLAQSVQVGDDCLDDLAAQKEHFLVLMVDVLILVAQNLHVDLQNPIKDLLLLRILLVAQLECLEELSQVQFRKETEQLLVGLRHREPKLKELLLIIAFEMLGAISRYERTGLKQVNYHSLIVALEVLVGCSLARPEIRNLVLQHILLDALEYVHYLVIALS
jgi:hypothetical protein